MTNPFNVGTETRNPFNSFIYAATTPTRLLNTVNDKLFDFGRDVFQGTTRSIGSFGATIGGLFGGDREIDEFDIKNPFGRQVFKAVFGSEPIKAVEDRIAKAEIDIQRNPFAKKMGLDKYAAPLAFAGIFGGSSLDLLPFGGAQKNVVKKLADEKTIGGVLQILKTLKVPQETAALYAPKLLKATQADEVENIFNMMKNTMPVEALKTALQTSKPLRSEIEGLQVAERGRRFGEASTVQSEVGGQAGYFAGLSKLKGELIEKPPTFTPLSQALSKQHTDDLFTAVQSNPMLGFGEKLTGQRGLQKLLDGHVPVPSELQVLEEVFGSDVIRAIFDKRPVSKKIWDLAGEIVADVPRALKTTLDMSATLRQAIVLGTRRPIALSKAFDESFKSMISNNYFEASLDAMRLTPEFKVAQDAGLKLSDPRKILGHREEYFLSNLADKIPVAGAFVRGSNRAYAGLLNHMRFNVFNDLAASFTVLGKADRANLESLANYINTATGSGSLGKLEQHAGLLSKFLFAPRYIASRVQWMNPVWYAKQTPAVRKEALKTFGTFVGTVTSLITLAKMSGAEVETDIRSSNFGKMKKGDSYIDLTFGFGLYIRLMGQLLTQEKKTQKGKVVELGGEGIFDESYGDVLERAIRGKLAPAWAAALDLAYGKNVVGEDVTIKSELIEQVTPLYVSDLMDALKHRGPSALLSVGLPAFLGVNIQTFKDVNETSGSTNPFNR